MVDRLDFEHQKEINLEAYTYGLVNRIDLNFVGIVEDFADLPLVGNSTNDAYYVRNGISNWMYIWNGAAWAKDSASGWWGGSINYTSFPTTLGNKMVWSVGLNADLIQETAIELDAAGNIIFPSGTTHDYTSPWVTITGTQNFDTNYTGNYDSSTLNFVDSTVNYDNTVNNYTNGSTTTYDNTTTVDMNGTTNITNANITNLTISGSVIGANTAWIEDFVWDWVTTIFTLANLPASDAFVWVSGNGVFSQDGIALDYTVSGLNVTFNTAPTLGYKVQIHYIQSLWTPLSFLSQVPTGTVDGVNDTFAIANAVNTNSESIYINGLLQYPTTHYTLTGTSLVFVTPPSIGDNLFAKWVY